MASKNKIVDAFAQAYEQLSSLALPDTAKAYLHQLQRAFTDLRHHDSEQTKSLEEMRATVAARDKKMEELRHEAQNAVQASKAKDAKISSKDARIAALENEIQSLASLIRKRLGPGDESEYEKRHLALENRLGTVVQQFVNECNPSPKVVHAFQRYGKLIVAQCGKDVSDAVDVFETYQQLLVLTCLRHGSMTLPASVPDDVRDSTKINLVKLDDGQWLVEAKTSEKAPTE